MRVALPESLADVLVHLPESGMGFQRVRVRLRDGRVLRGLVAFNCSEIEVPATVGALTSSDVVDVGLDAPPPSSGQGKLGRS